MSPLYQELKDAIVAAVPSIRTHYNRCMSCGFGFARCQCGQKRTDWFTDREIRLADVLLAIEQTEIKGGEVEYTSYGTIFHIGHYAEFGRKGYYDKCYWTLEKDLSHQSEETISFLHGLLVTK